MRFCEAAWFDLPLAAAGRIAGSVDEKSLSEAGWKAYEAWVGLANEAANRLYANPAFGEATGRAFETALKLQRVGDALASAFFANLWPALGLPTQSQINALRDEVIALREQVANAPSAQQSQPPPQPPAEQPSASAEWPRALRNGSSRETAAWANGEGKQRVAA
ncbi:MAG TPA: hypothetical protein VEF07_06835 [Candidatus Binataceae bacterium]|nr:hypothetical protein [Candidatus Binataceae bacterium]